MMKREILFRGKRVDNGEWVYGYYYPRFWMCGNGVEEDVVIRLSDGSKEITVIPESVGQFTGLLDKNGNKIFEGDLVEYPDYSNGAYFGSPQPRRIIEIKYEEIFNGYGYKQLHCDSGKLDIKGNIHDTP